jgi:hypothetical protein
MHYDAEIHVPSSQCEAPAIFKCKPSDAKTLVGVKFYAHTKKEDS